MHHIINHILNYVYKKYINYLRGIKCTPIVFPCGSYIDASDPPKGLAILKNVKTWWISLLEPLKKIMGDLDLENV
jgi:hypothetical protein